MVIQQFCTRPH